MTKRVSPGLLKIRRLREAVAEELKNNPPTPQDITDSAEMFRKHSLAGLKTSALLERFTRQQRLFASFDPDRFANIFATFSPISQSAAFTAMGAGGVFDVSRKMADISALSSIEQPLLDEMRDSVASIARINYTADIRRQFLELTVPGIEDRSAVMRNLLGTFPDPNTHIKQLVKGLNKSMAFQFDWEKLSQPWMDSYRKVFDNLSSSAAFLVRYREMAHQGAHQFVTTYGWALPMAIPAGKADDLVALTGSPRLEVRAAMIRTFAPRTRAYSACRDQLLESESLTGRKSPLEQALRSMRRGENYAAISTMLPLVEGAMVDVAFKGKSTPKRGAVDKAFSLLSAERERELSDKWVLRMIETLAFAATAGVALFEGFNRSDFGVPGESRVLNRHAILHGAARRYGTTENALKLFLLLVAVSEMLDGFDANGPVE